VDPLTQQVLKALAQRREEIKYRLVKGHFWEDGDALEQIGLKVLVEITKADILEEIVGMDYESFVSLLKEADADE
jgi:hypothetical protein